MSQIADQEMKYLKGVGPKRAELLEKELGIKTCRDLLYYFPYRYIDRSRIYAIKDIDTTQAFIQVKGKISHFRIEGQKYKQRLVAVFTDGTGTMELVWFQGIQWVTRNYQPNIEYIVFGKPGLYNRKLSIAHPEIEMAGVEDDRITSAFQPQYSSTEKLRTNFFTSRTIHKLIGQILALSPGLEETLPEALVSHLRLMSLNEAIRNLHFPENSDKLRKATYRLKFEELFYIQLNILLQKTKRLTANKGLVFSKVGDNLNNFYKTRLSFELTEAQKRVVKEIRKDMGSGRQMNRLLQGDVGSGKTLVALMAMLIALDNGYQACLMAPTELLANQHYNTISRFVENMGVGVYLLTGSTRKNEREELHEQLRSGTLHILIGTHALLEDTVQFNNLGLVIIDEQHRFGVAQRAKLWKKTEQYPHVLVMTATPIPRTLAMTLYGDLDVSVIDELPPGRKPIQTIHYYESKRLVLFGFLRNQIKQGRQVYIVYPLIRESEKLDLVALEEGYEAIVRAFPPPEYAVVCVHGQMKPEDKESGMQLFIKGKAQIMVATTVIEVGVDIPNASVMVIENAERFGLSQLHQLRGRVGRGADQSYCVLMSSYKLSNEAKKRLELMVNTNDGFEIAEADLKLRGPGDIEGTQQSGIPFDLKIANLGQDGQILQYARDIATRVLEADPYLQKPQNQVLRRQLSALSKSVIDWSSIS
ncbi:MAG TPA: ATP-dependent DNA helicase RecG [Bacteroidales bacterium]|nr:ATP-dependent DNA helicase RecG [Bacteroidales bacterium]